MVALHLCASQNFRMNVGPTAAVAEGVIESFYWCVANVNNLNFNFETIWQRYSLLQSGQFYRETVYVMKNTAYREQNIGCGLAYDMQLTALLRVCAFHPASPFVCLSVCLSVLLVPIGLFSRVWRSCLTEHDTPACCLPGNQNVVVVLLVHGVIRFQISDLTLAYHDNIGPNSSSYREHRSAFFHSVSSHFRTCSIKQLKPS